MGAFKLLLITMLSLSLSGCAEITHTAEDVIKNPLSTTSVRIGMTKDRVKELWGEPEQINFVEDAERWGGPREEWVYTGKLSAIPVDADYLSKTKRLYFDGENLTNIVED